ncbi:MAG: FMN-dependent NADH-azoreductase [Rhodobacterales bacterium]|nr:FMN-dependent NADH-azoreductase [Rhodobacterales bacterium]
MTNLLLIDSSPRGDASVTRRLTAAFQAAWRAAGRGDAIRHRDLAETPVPHLDGTILGAFFSPAENHTPEQAAAAALSETLVSELEAADVIVIGAPMFNFAIPSVLKAYIDHVARAGRTFRYTEAGPQGLLTGKKVYVLTARGGPASAMDFVEPYLRGMLGFLGLTDVTFIAATDLNMGADPAAKALAAADRSVAQAVTALAA